MSNYISTALRNTIKQIRSKTSEPYHRSVSEKICLKIQKLENYHKAKHLALYSAIHKEIDLNLLWHKASEEGKSCYFPALTKDFSLHFLPANADTPFRLNPYGILEPDVDSEKAIPLNELDLILMPLVAFDFRCSRLGMGAGYYDRTLKTEIKASLLGVGYQFQRVDFIDPQPWDVPMDGVITQNATYWR